MGVLPDSVQKVIDAFEKLPGVGPKSAARMAYHFLRARNNDAINLANSLLTMDQNVVNCRDCFNVSETEVCSICDSPLRDTKQLCVVEDPLDVVAFENSGVYKGVYFVLGGVISPADGIGADELRFPELRMRVGNLTSKIRDHKSSGEMDVAVEFADNPTNKGCLELIIATNPNLEGEATAVYIQDLFRKEISEGTLHITRLAMGLPTGADLEYTDRLTLKRALEGRRAY
jgi:recombination protein RecR